LLFNRNDVTRTEGSLIKAFGWIDLIDDQGDAVLGANGDAAGADAASIRRCVAGAPGGDWCGKRIEGRAATCHGGVERCGITSAKQAH